MKLTTRLRSLEEAQSYINLCHWGIGGLIGVLLLFGVAFVAQSKIVIMRTPGVNGESKIEKDSADKATEFATLAAVTNNIAQINPSNVDYEKQFLQAYLSPDVYTSMSKSIDDKVAKLTEQRELGSYYFVLKDQRYDPKLETFFMSGDVHTVNAAKDTPKPYVFEYKRHWSDYRFWVDSIDIYEGDKPHDSTYLEQQKSQG